MDIQICKWYNNADSPVLFMVDDLANVWVDVNGNGKIDLGEDWGYAKSSEKSSFKYLNEVILKDYPEVKVTFFTPVGVRIGMIEKPKIKSISKMINCDEETKRFFKEINRDSKYEIAYHGTTHGKAQETNKDFIQEWQTYKSLDEAIDRIDYGKEIYKEVFGEYPIGGKYCGYLGNEFSDMSIEKSGFLWWCRYWNRGLEDDRNCNIGGSDYNSITNLDIKTFGKNNVIDIPSTINGGLFTDILSSNKRNIKGVIKHILIKYIIMKRINQIDYLLKNNLVISIQEHISPSRDDGRIQMPNIFDDTESLKYIFNYLKDKKVWFCTGSELAKYIIARDHITIQKIDENNFFIKCDKNIRSLYITIKVSNKANSMNLPDGKKINLNSNIVNICILEGVYRLE